MIRRFFSPPAEGRHPGIPPGIRPLVVGFALGAAGLGILWFLVLNVGQPREDATWRAIQERGSWRVGLDPSFPPFEYLNDRGTPVGYDVALAEELAEEWDVALQLVPMGFDSLLDALLAGKIDSVVSAYPQDPRLAQDVAFSPPYFEAGILLAVPPGSPIAGVADLAGSTVAVEWGGMGDVIGRRLQDQMPDLTLSTHETAAAAVAAVDGVIVAAALVDGVTLRLMQARGLQLSSVGDALEPNPYTIVMPRGASELRQQVSAALMRLQQDGTLVELEAEWFAAGATEDPPREP